MSKKSSTFAPAKVCAEEMKGILLAIGIVAVALVLLCVGVIFRKDHSFRSQHIHENKRMKEDGIKCALAEDAKARRSKTAPNAKDAL